MSLPSEYELIEMEQSAAYVEHFYSDDGRAVRLAADVERLCSVIRDLRLGRAGAVPEIPLQVQVLRPAHRSGSF